MLKVNIDIQDRQINGQTGNVWHIKFAWGSVGKVFVQFFEEQAGMKAMKLPCLCRQYFWVAIEKSKTEIPI